MKSVSNGMVLLNLVLFLFFITFSVFCYASEKKGGSRAYSNEVTESEENALSRVNIEKILAGQINLDDLLYFALKNNPGIKAARAKWFAAKEKILQAKSLDDPRLSFTWFAEPIVTRNGPQQNRAGISQKFPLAGKRRIRGEAAALAANVEYHDYVRKRLQLVRDLRKLFYEYQFLKASIHITDEHLKILKFMESIASVRFQTASFSQSSLIRIQVEQSRLGDRLEKLGFMRKSVSARIKGLMGTDKDALLPWPDVEIRKSDKLDIKRLHALLEETNPDLLRLKALIRKAEKNISLAKKQSVPDLTLGVDRFNVRGGDNPVSISFSVNLPIHRARIRSAVDEAILKKDELKHGYADLKNRLSADLNVLVYKYEDARQRAFFYKESVIPKAQQAIDISLKEFESDSISITGLLENQRSLLEFTLALAQESIKALKLNAEIESLMTPSAVKGE